MAQIADGLSSFPLQSIILAVFANRQRGADMATEGLHTMMLASSSPPSYPRPRGRCWFSAGAAGSDL
ncbi:hypothetical protein HMPREF9946_01934 [Acetobacteraceae bacterium AT-5844]|nr:hypothetical protein HMPREF9946_01934 [Acetobacteraceae bacterium AT-5844]